MAQAAVPKLRIGQANSATPDAELSDPRNQRRPIIARPNILHPILQLVECTGREIDEIAVVHGDHQWQLVRREQTEALPGQPITQITEVGPRDDGAIYPPLAEPL